MAIAAEHLYVSCTCTNGMRDGLRCADCGGRGVVLKGTTPTGEAVPLEPGEGLPEDEDPFENMSVKHLRSRAKDLGLSAGGTKAELVTRIREATREGEDGEVDQEEADDLD